MTELRVPYDDLEWEDDVYYYKGVPLSGTVYFLFPNGELKIERQYHNGLLHGIAREWNEKGQLIKQTECKEGVGHGLSKTFYPGGQIRSEVLVEWGIKVRYREWNEIGVLIEDWKIGPSSPSYSLLLKRRKLYSGNSDGNED